ncbi:MAG TPA: Mur ligase family protein [Candidatus Binatia bacterium]|nr:Mur ligase family protein [Candidatus Binatia bacterium]
MRRARPPGEKARTGPIGGVVHRLGFWALDVRERASPWARWPLHAVARLHRRLHPDVPLVVVTGSTGKTTTHALVARVLAERFSVIATGDRDNSDLQFHRYVLRSRSKANHALVLEAGIQRPGNAARWNRAIDPDVVLLTNVGDSHLAWLGSREGVLAEKIALARNLKRGGTVLLNADDELLARVRLPHRVLTFGVKSAADFVARDVRADASGLALEVVGPDWTVALRSPLVGPRNAYAVVAAAACGWLFGIAPDAIARAIGAFAPESAAPRRLVRRERAGMTVIDDTYSASPQAVVAGLEALAAEPGRKVAILGDMLELGEAGARLHEELGREIARSYPDLRLFTVGPLARRIADGARAGGLPAERVTHAGDKIALLEALARDLAPGDAVLVKGSAGTHMEQVVAELGEPPFASPLESMPAVRAIGAFGAHRRPERTHEGIDLPAAIGTPVRAFARGRIASVRFEPGYGKVVRIRHFTNVETVYAHLSRFVVRRGEVARGQPIALSGRSGILHDGSQYDYPHLHFEIRIAGVAIDPCRHWPDIAPAAPA